MSSHSQPDEDTDPADLPHQEKNRARGQLPGQVTIRLRYRGLATHGFELLNLSARELEDLVAETGWLLVHLVRGRAAGVLRGPREDQPHEWKTLTADSAARRRR
jgi:hypothetical protein